MSQTTQNAYGTSPNNPFGGFVFSFNTPELSYVSPTATFGYAPSMGVSTNDPNALAALQNSFVSQGANGLGEITNIGAAEYVATKNIFSTFGSNLNALSQSIADSFAQSVNKSAQACSGLFGCLF